MSIETSSQDYIIYINSSIEHIDSKGQYMNLASPIHIAGQLNLSKLLSQHEINTNNSTDEHPLQIGVDEAGRGPLLGSVNVAAAILPSAWSGLIEAQPLKNTPLAILTDSKKLSEKKRDLLYPLVQWHAIGYVVADIPAAVIDQVNILQATMLGMRICTEALLELLASQLAPVMGDIGDINGAAAKSTYLQAQVLYDGNRCPELDYARLATLGIEKSAIDCQAWVKGDARHTSIAAASILAKVSRDQTMYELDSQYPQYGIAKHKGYPTRAHMHAIEEHGVLAAHRRSFAPVRRALESK
ncbi:ribonuclease HII [Psychrobacter sp. PL15]|uniref:ribonuclease HII n=1 Tax=unclassified Psychrobacter TaxID=196806 RepID=UPI001AE9A8D8|nr:ribonuclease HII [Psychrobacter sp. PL15]MEC5211222.1 ribonuclease HII [Psychrobacter sp. PL15]